ncbi:hypothetical protein E8E13_006109 [Curvularia kusanoi]|uniref:Pisatin demethylase n=1 Tax=Curvularia kusanoi TaxID=90978 RepID=A0A9P4T7R2_CURKU|nr:hypothetical protein E8E13_006109 [Curvularia kusanoi]
MAGFTNLYRLQRVLTGKAHLLDISLHRKYGSVVRLGPNLVSIGDPLAIPTIYGITASLPKSSFYPVNFTYSNGKLIPGIFATTSDVLHRQMKRPIASFYSMTNILAYEPLVDDTIRVFVDQLQERYALTGTPCDLSDWLQYYAFDVIGAVTFSTRIGFLERGRDIDNAMEGIWRRFRYFALIGQIPWLDWFWDKNPILNKIFPAKSSPIAKFAMQLTGKRLEQLRHNSFPINSNSDPVTPKRDLLSSFLDAKAKAGEKVPDWYLTSWTISNLLAGSDTTAIYLRSVFYYLLRNPTSLCRVLDELKLAEDEKRLSAIISYKESKSLTYLDACIKEAGRLHPSIGLPLERVVPRGGLQINGYYLPEGTIVGVNAWASQHDMTLFGRDADEWRPERWLVNAARSSELDRAMMLFGTGHRSCLGKHIALVEIYKVVPQILRNFEIKWADPSRDWKTENFWAVRQTNMEVVFCQKPAALEQETQAARKAKECVS